MNIMLRNVTGPVNMKMKRESNNEMIRRTTKGFYSATLELKINFWTRHGLLFLSFSFTRGKLFLTMLKANTKRTL